MPGPTALPEIPGTSSGRLQFQGVHAPSLGPKFAILAALSLATLTAAWLMFVAPEPHRLQGDRARRIVLLACALVYLARVSVTFLVFLKRRIPWWEAGVGGGLIAVVVFWITYGGGGNAAPLAVFDGIGGLLYLLGSLIGTGSEYGRHRWKGRPENVGHLYTKGLFRYSRHINYFGDLLLFSGFAALSGDPGMLVFPAAMTLSFVFWIVPAQDRYLATRYGGEFEAYAARTPRLIPWVY
jgi:protein-S-isoprenylcysteine O-methyltransferase Ste14